MNANTPESNLLSRQFECVEIYFPKKLENLSKLYAFLQKKLVDRQQGVEQEVKIDGFSLYEVDGAFYGQELYQERTIVIRILIQRCDALTATALNDQIQILGREIAVNVALEEEQLWISHHSQAVIIIPS